MEAADWLLLDGTLLTMDPQNRVIEEGGLAVRGGRIVALGSSQELRQRFSAPVVHLAKGKAVLPGFIDTYGHAGHSMIKGFHRPDLGWPAGGLYWHATTPEWWYADGLLAAAERLRFGVTTGLSIVGSTPARTDDPIYASQQARAYAQVGVRAVLGVGPPDPLVSHLAEPWSGSHFEGGRWVERHFSYPQALENTAALIEQWHGAAQGRIGMAFASAYLLGRHMPHPRFSFTLPPNAAQVIWQTAQDARQMASRYGVPIHTHMFKGSVSYGLHHYGHDLAQVLGPDVLIAHANALEPQEVQTLGQYRCNISLVAYTAENVHYGFAPIVELIEAGANVTITTDGSAPYMSFDLWQDLKRTLWHAWLSHRSQKVLPAGKTLRMVTIEAAQALGMQQEVGSLEVGKKADVITVNLQQTHLSPRTFLPQQLVYYATGHDVSEVWVEGQLLLQQGRYLHLDVPAILELAEREAQSAFARYNIEPFRESTPGFWQGSRWEE